MYVSITRLKLSSPVGYIGLIRHVSGIKGQLKNSNCVRYRLKGFGLTHYTMSLWRSKEDIEAFTASEAHLNAMRMGAKFTREIKVLTIDSTNLVPWNEARALVESAKPIKF